MSVKLLFLGTSNGSCDMVKYAKKKEVYTIVTDNLPIEKSEAKKLADEIWNISTGEVDLLENKCKEENVTGVICGCSEFNIDKALELSTRLGFPFYCTEEAWHYARDKYDFKKLCRECGAPVAKDYFLSDELTPEEIKDIEYPVVVKPVDRGANYGISFCNNDEELREAFKLVRSVSNNPKIVVEKMLHGEEYYSSYAIVNGEVRFLALNAMYAENGYPSNCYTITTTVASNIQRFIDEINPAIENVLKKVGCTDGYAWVQVMKDEDDRFYVIEMGYRLDGDMMFIPYRDLINYDALAHLVDVAIGEKDTSKHLPVIQTKPLVKCGLGYMLWTKSAGVISRIEGLDVVAKTPGFLVEMRRVPGDDFGIYRPLGTITYTSKDCDDLCEKIDFLNKTIHVYDEKGDDVVIKYTDFNKLKSIYNKELGYKSGNF